MGTVTPSEYAGRPAASASPPSLPKLWPNRVHESNWLKGLLCRLGLHRWYRLTLGPSFPVHGADFCRWCDAVVLARVR